MIDARFWLCLGAILAGTAVGAGAFAAHGLDSYFAKKYAGEEREQTGIKIPASQKYLADFKTGAEYQMYHALALLAVGLLALQRPSSGLNFAGWSFVVGIVLFSGGLYLLATTGQRWTIAIIPVGGTAFLVGWAALAVAAVRLK
jgi:uncharacterized membrane protein YgdD (TMEM256/DUF423 family)